MTTNLYELVNKCETAEELSSAVLACAVDGRIQGRVRTYDAEKMANAVSSVIKGYLPFNMLTRNYGIRQQAMYIAHYEGTYLL